MRFYTEEECRAWADGLRIVTPQEGHGVFEEHVWFPRWPGGLFWVADWMATSMTSRDESLLWITEWWIWRSHENWHLYDRLRRSYGDNRLLHEAPGHFFQDYETADLASFLQLAMLNGWGGYLLTKARFLHAFFSHDEWIHFYADTEVALEDVRRVLVPRSVPPPN